MRFNELSLEGEINLFFIGYLFIISFSFYLKVGSEIPVSYILLN